MSFREVESKKDICPICEEERKIKLGYKKEALTIRGEPIEIESMVEYCPTCGEFFADTETEEENIQKAYRAYRKAHGLLQPEEIKEIREKYGISQRALSRILGWGEITLHRYESGGLQDQAHNNELLLLKDPDNFWLLFEKNQDKLAPHLVKRVKKRLAEFSEEKQVDFLQKRLESLFGLARVDITSGFRYFDLEKFENAILFFTHKASVFKTKLNKLLWYFDFLCYKENNLSATGSIYIHLPYGPVPTNYDFYLANLIKERILAVDEITFDRPEDIAGEVFSALESPDLSVFSDDELRCLEKVYDSFKGFTSGKISEYSHDEEGYKNTQDGDIISYEWAKSLKI